MNTASMIIDKNRSTVVFPINKLIKETMTEPNNIMNRTAPNRDKSILVTYPNTAIIPNNAAAAPKHKKIDPRLYTKNTDANVSPVKIEYPKKQVIAPALLIFVTRAEKTITKASSAIIKAMYNQVLE